MANESAYTVFRRTADDEHLLETEVRAGSDQEAIVKVAKYLTAKIGHDGYSMSDSITVDSDGRDVAGSHSLADWDRKHASRSEADFLSKDDVS